MKISRNATRLQSQTRSQQRKKQQQGRKKRTLQRKKLPLRASILNRSKIFQLLNIKAQNLRWIKSQPTLQKWVKMSRTMKWNRKPLKTR